MSVAFLPLETSEVDKQDQIAPQLKSPRKYVSAAHVRSLTT